VSHHPPVSCAHAESDLWEYDITSAPKTMFWGNSVEVRNINDTRIRLKRTGEEFSLSSPDLAVYNIVLRNMWIDVYGRMVVQNTCTGHSCVLEYSPCGWFGSKQFEVHGHVRDDAGRPKLVVQGRWNDHLRFAPCGADGKKEVDAAETQMYQCAPKPRNHPYAFTAFARDALCSWDSTRHGLLLRSDSRLRPDRHALQNGDSSSAQSEKYVVECRQRNERTRLVNAGDTWTPRWFHASKEPTSGDFTVYAFSGKWPARGALSTEAYSGNESLDRCKELYHPWR